MERYEAYKDSRVEWIGEIPSTWTLARTKAVFSSKKRVVGDKANEYQRLALTMHGVLLRDKDDNEGLQPEQFEGYQILEANELVFKLIDLENIKTSRVGLSPYTGIVSPAYITLTQTDSDNRYFYYWFFALYQQNVFNQLGGNGVRSALNKDDLLNLPMLLPKQDEQRAIANYLDAKTAEIDALVADCEREVGLLQEYRKAVISEAVTKGLDPDAPMKDSGIKWIGKIPENWHTNKVKRLFVNRDVSRIPIEASLRDQSTDVLYPYYGASGIVDYISDYIFDEDLLLIGEDGANLVLRNLPLIYAASGKYWVNNHAHILQPGNDIDYWYAYFQLELIDLKDYITGSTQPKLTAENLGRIPCVVPPLQEQREIASFLDTKTAEIDALIKDKQTMADKLREYRKSLISEAVTGKFKVPGI